jgi:DNA-directed RNA polymerase subunit L
MSKLMADVSSGKVAYQAYTIEHGIEQLKIRVPLQETKAFERELNEALEAGKTSKKNVMGIVEAHGGSLRKVS